MNRLLKWNFQRKFGLEYEFTNSYRDLRRMVDVVRTNTDHACESRSYEHTRENYDTWVCKTDASCGIELVSPIFHGPKHLRIAAEILPHLDNANFNIGNSCGQHVHVEIADFSSEQVAILSAYWMKVERFILNGTPSHRRSNTYCTLLTHCNSNLTPDQSYTSEYVLRHMANGRNAINFQNWSEGRGTVEFRFGEMTFDPEAVKNRVRFLIWLVEMCKILPPPQNLKWFTPKESLSVFNLWKDSTSFIKYQYSPAVQSMRKWMIKRFIQYAPDVFSRDIEICRNMLVEIEETTTLTTEQEM